MTLQAIETPFANVTARNDMEFGSGSFSQLNLAYDQQLNALWMRIANRSSAYFSDAQLTEIRRVQSSLSDGTALPISNYKPAEVRYVVFASDIPSVFSLGGDLKLFHSLIEKRNRSALSFYARKATEAVYNHHACGAGRVTSISLIQGQAMGGGMEAALAGNVLVAEKGVRMGFPEVLFGLFPGMGAYALLRRRVGPSTAQRLIVEAVNMSAESLHELGVVDVLAEPGQGRQAVETYLRLEKNRPGAAAFRKSVQKYDPLSLSEMYDVAEFWVDTALALDDASLRRMRRLIQRQTARSSTPTVASVA